MKHLRKHIVNSYYVKTLVLNNNKNKTFRQGIYTLYLGVVSGS